MAMSDYDSPSEFILQREPFAVRRVVKWHECDPAGVVYAANFLTYASSANHMFLGHLLSGPLHHRKVEMEIDVPAKAISFVFHSSLRPEEYFDMSVGVVRIGKTSFTNQVVGKSLAGRPVFTAHLTLICVIPSGPNDRSATPIPDRLRTGLQRYVAARIDNEPDE